MDTWYDKEKVKANLTFDSAEWSKTRKILDDPNVSDDEKKEAWNKYKQNLFKKIGAIEY